MCVKPVFILFLNKQITVSENIPSQRREVIASRNANSFCGAVDFRREEISDEEHEEILRSSDRLFEKNLKAFEQPLNSFSSSCASLLKGLICTNWSSSLFQKGLMLHQSTFQTDWNRCNALLIIDHHMHSLWE